VGPSRIARTFLRRITNVDLDALNVSHILGGTAIGVRRVVDFDVIGRTASYRFLGCSLAALQGVKGTMILPKPVAHPGGHDEGTTGSYWTSGNCQCEEQSAQ